jgi:hypothetical protein
MYFGKPVHEAIMKYQQSDDFVERERLVKDIILPAMMKLSENIIHKYKHYNYGNRSYLDVRYECVVHLMDRLHKFNGERGFKAFSYFDKIARNWVLADMRQSKVTIMEAENFDVLDRDRNVFNELDRVEYEEDLRTFFKYWSNWGIKHLETLFHGYRERQIAEAIFNLFKNCHYINIYEKKELYVLIREQVDSVNIYDADASQNTREEVKVRTTSITNVVNKLKVLQKNMFLEFMETETKYWGKYIKLVEKPTNEKTKNRTKRRSPVYDG